MGVFALEIRISCTLFVKQVFVVIAYGSLVATFQFIGVRHSSYHNQHFR